jgi:hypothetical protein
MTIFVVSIFLKCTNLPNSKSQYSILEKAQHDSVKVYLLKDLIDTVDMVKFKNYSSFLEDKYLDFKIDYSKGWSCLYKDSLINLENERRRLMSYVELEERFLNTIIINNNLRAGDELKIINYWKQLQNIQSVTSIDGKWKINLDSFKRYVVYNKQQRIDSKYNIDSCEVLMYKSIFKEIDSIKKDEIWMSIDWILSRHMPFNSNIYFNRVYKKCKFEYGKSNSVEVKIEDQNTIKFR